MCAVVMGKNIDHNIVKTAWKHKKSETTYSA